MLNSNAILTAGLVILFYVLLLFGDTYLLFWLIPVVLAYLLLSEWLVLKKSGVSIAVGQNRVELAGWVYFFSLGGLAFFSQSFSLSLQAIITFLTAFTVFIFVGKARKFIDVRVLAYLLILLTLLISVTAGFFALLPEYGYLLHGRNIVFANYGHNHLSALLLLAIPVAWGLTSYEMLQDQANRAENRALLAISIGITLLVPFTYGRVAIGIVFLELLLLAWQTKKVLPVVFRSLVAVIGIFLIAGLFFLFTSLLPMSAHATNPICSYPGLWLKLCKPIYQEKRVEYWAQAVQGFLAYPVTGYGPGTFEIISYRFRSVPDGYSAYAHNDVLQKLAENGVFGFTIFVTFMGLLFRDALADFSLKPKKPIELRTFFQIALIGIGLNSLLDFDLHFLGIVTLMFSYAALSFKVPGANSDKLFFTVITKKLYYLGLALLAIIALIFYSAEFMIAQSNYAQVSHYFPHFVAHSKLLIKFGDIQTQQKLIKVYKNHSMVLSDYLEKNTFDPVVSKQLDQINPWHDQFYEAKVGFYLERKEWELAYLSLVEVRDEITSFESKTSGYFSYERKKVLAMQATQLSDVFYRQKKYDQAGRLLAIAAQFDGQTFGFYKPPFALQDSEDEGFGNYVENVVRIEDQAFIANSEEFASIIITYLKNNDQSNFDLIQSKVLTIAPWRYYELAELTLTQLNTILSSEVLNSDNELLQATELNGLISSTYRLTTVNPSSGYYFSDIQPAYLARVSSKLCLLNQSDLSQLTPQTKIELQALIITFQKMGYSCL